MFLGPFFLHFPAFLAGSLAAPLAFMLGVQMRDSAQLRFITIPHTRNANKIMIKLLNGRVFTSERVAHVIDSAPSYWVSKKSGFRFLIFFPSLTSSRNVWHCWQSSHSRHTPCSQWHWPPSISSMICLSSRTSHVTV